LQPRHHLAKIIVAAKMDATWASTAIPAGRIIQILSSRSIIRQKPYS
jgi:hypothetical protein